MVVDIQAPPNDENISTRKSDPKILMVRVPYRQFHKRLTVFRLFALSPTASGSYRNASSGENNFIRKTESNFFIGLVVSVYIFRTCLTVFELFT
jgi:hypothetical protein